MFTNILTGHCTTGHQTLFVYRSVPLTVFKMVGFKLKEDNRQQEEKLAFSHVHGLFLTKFLVHIYIDPSYHPAVSRVDKYGNTLYSFKLVLNIYIMNEVLAQYACTFENYVIDLKLCTELRYYALTMHSHVEIFVNNVLCM